MPPWCWLLLRASGSCSKAGRPENVHTVSNDDIRPQSQQAINFRFVVDGIAQGFKACAFGLRDAGGVPQLVVADDGLAVQHQGGLQPARPQLVQ